MNRSVEESLSGLERVIERARGEGLRCEGVISVSFGCPYEGEVPPERVFEIADAAARRRVATRSPSATRPGWRTRAQVREFFARGVRAAAGRRADGPLPQHPRPGPRERARGARGGRALVRVVVRRAGRLPGARRARPATSRPRTSSRCCTRWATTGIDLDGAARLRARRPGASRPPAREPPAHGGPGRLAPVTRRSRRRRRGAPASPGRGDRAPVRVGGRARVRAARGGRLGGAGAADVRVEPFRYGHTFGHAHALMFARGDARPASRGGRAGAVRARLLRPRPAAAAPASRGRGRERGRARGAAGAGPGAGRSCSSPTTTPPTPG